MGTEEGRQERRMEGKRREGREGREEEKGNCFCLG